LKTLHLLRHAKSDRDNPRLKDHERPLAKRGVKSAQLIAGHMAKTGFHVDRVICSTAVRTRETYELVAPSLAGAAVTYSNDVYLADPKTLLDLVRHLPTSTASVLLIGHNPGFHILATDLAQDADSEEELEAVREKYPTGALCSLKFDTDSWREIGPGIGHLTAFIRPRDFD
jgi:phosphohistidine phosphatase